MSANNWSGNIQRARGILLVLLWVAYLTLTTGIPSAYGSIDDDYYDGNIFVLYAGNGSLVPPKLNLEQAQKLGKPALLVFYVDDSKDCKQYARSLNLIQARYTPALSIIPINADSLTPEQPESQYFHGLVPQTVLIDRQGRVVYDAVGYSIAETVNQQVYNLLSREAGGQ